MNIPENRVKSHSSSEYYIVEIGSNVVSSREMNRGEITQVNVRPKEGYHPLKLTERESVQKIVDYLQAGKIVRIVEVSTTIETRFYEESLTEVI